jgi:3'(2'), 5'-bisphosphate nucleotidase
MFLNQILVKPITEIALQAGQEILEIYDHKTLFSSTRIKRSKSPYTLAKNTAENLIVGALTSLDNSIPIISEGHNEVSYYYRKNWKYLWLVDALNGTREFLKQTNEFTINIALIENGIPILGIIYAPALELLYSASKTEGAFRTQKNNTVPIHCNTAVNFLTAVVNPFVHLAMDEEKSVLDRFPIKKIISVGSSLKFCKIAEGSADLFYRHSPSMEWETAAGEAIINISGGAILHANSRTYKYNKQMLKNKALLCIGNSAIASHTIFEENYLVK